MPTIMVAWGGFIEGEFSKARAASAPKGACWICHTRKFGKGPLKRSVDHVEPLSLGGRDEPSNIRMAHAFCNSMRGELDLTHGILDACLKALEKQFGIKGVR